MIRIIRQLRVRDIDGSSSFSTLPLIPASGTFRRVSESGDNGKAESIEIRARLKWEADRAILHKDLIMELTFDNGDTESVGTVDMPLRLNVEENGPLIISASYLRRL